jgi:DNA adenine methylase
MKSAIPYFGGKTTTAPWIVSMLPAHQHYVEPFCGSLAVLLAKPPSPQETVNDLDGRLVNFWRVLRDATGDLVRACEMTPHSRAEYSDALARIGDESLPGLERARLAWVILHQGRGRRFDGHEGWRHAIGRASTGGGQHPVATTIDRAVDLIAPCAERLRTVTLECLPALDLIAKYGAHRDVLLYVDPPYLGTTRSGPNRYGLEMASEAGHRELAGALGACKAAVVLSGYTSPLYDELYGGWHCERLSTTTGNGADGKRSRVEVLWSNRPLGAQGVLDLGLGYAA